METEEKDKGGCQDCTCAPCKEIARSRTNTLLHPFICRMCEDEYHSFNLPGHPDDGIEFACGMMVEKMNEDCTWISCGHFKPKAVEQVRSVKELLGIIDADKEQEKARVERLLAQGRRYQETGDVRSFTRPVITEEPVPGYQEPSPHPFMDPIVAKINEEQATIRKVTPHVE